MRSRIHPFNAARAKNLRFLPILLIALAGCGGEDEPSASKPPPPPPESEPAGPATAPEAEEALEQAKGAEAKGTKIILRGSEFGTMLFGADRQAIYIFERDPKGRSVCYGECAAAWPPVYTDGEPQAGKGVRQSLLGTVKRRDGKLQVTYAGKPLYFYVNEGPGEVRCHNVNLNGGLWWVVGPDGRRRA